MPGRPDTTDVDLSGGLDLNDAKNLPAGNFAALDNADFDPIRLRHGHAEYPVIEFGAQAFGTAGIDYPNWAYGHGPYSSLVQGSVDHPSAGRVYGVASLEDEQLAWDGWRLFTRSSAPNSKWARIGGANGEGRFCHAEESSLGWVGNDAVHFDVAVGRHRTLYVWVEGTSPYYSIIDNETGAVAVARSALSTGASSVTQVKPVYLTQDGQSAGTFFVLCDDSTQSAFYTLIPEIDYENVSTGTAASNRASATTPVDVRSHNGRAYLVYVSSAPALVVNTFNQAGNSTTTTLDTDGTTPADSASAIGVHPDGTVLAAWYTTGNLVRSAFYSLDHDYQSSRLYSAASLGTGVGDVADRITCDMALLKATNYRGAVAWWRASDDRVNVQEVSGSTGGAGRGYGDCRLTHQMFRVGDANYFTVGYVRASTIQHQLVTLEAGNASHKGHPVSSSFRTTFYADAAAHNWVRQSARTNFEDLDNGATFAQASELARLLPTADGVQQVKQGAGVVHYDFLPPLRTAKVGESVWFAGGIVKEYDGNTLHEVGALVFPQISGALVAGGSLPTTGAPQYRAYLCHENARGELHRSAALTYIGPTPSGGNLTVRLTLPMVPFVTVDTVYWEIYRLDHGASLFKRLAKVTPSSLNTAHRTDTTYDDTGTTITSNAVDPAPSYAPNGLGTLDKICPPSCTVIAEGKERVWFAGGGVPERHVAYSRLYDSGEAAAWNEALVVNVPGEGKVTGIGFVADWAVVFRPSATYVFGGPGPDNLGVSGDYDPPRIAVADSGCIAPDSVLLLPFGLIRQSQAGIRVLTPGLDDVAIGGPVDKALDVSTQVTAAALSPMWQQARFATSEATYVLDYGGKPRWSRWTLDVSGFCTYRGRVLAGTLDGTVLLEQSEDEDTSRDGARGYDLHLQTGWLRPAAANSLANLDWWYLGLTWRSGTDDAGLRMRTEYDYKIVGPAVDERDWRPTQVVSSAQDVGDSDLSGSTYGSGSPSWYPTFGDAEVRRRFKRRRASSVRFDIRSFGGLRAEVNNMSIEYRPDIGMAGRGTRNLS